jgi:hypothetical protein
MEIRDALAAVGNAPVSDEEFIGYLSKLFAAPEEHPAKHARTGRADRSRKRKWCLRSDAEELSS